MHPRSSILECAARGALTILLSGFIGFATPALASAQRGGSIDSLARAFRAKHPAPAMVIGVIDSRGKRIFPYGTTGADSAAVGGDTRFEVGSVTKVFTSLLLARMTESGKVRLEDPISSFLPDSIHAPEYRGQPITLGALATHSSSLPRLPGNIAPANMLDPYADYTADKLYAFLDSYDLPQAPGTHYEYSNLGAGLLGFILSRHAGEPYAKLVEQRVFRPLGMADSYIAELGDSADPRLAHGHAEGKEVPFWHFGSLEGAGAAISSTNDLLRLLEAELHPRRTQMAEAITLSQKIHFRASPELSLALGWHVVQLPDSSSLYWHNGGTGGARSFVGFSPALGAGFTLLVNEAIPLDVLNQFAFELARTLMGGEAARASALSSPGRH
ncbi:MAG TPA: serine hydrolase domain-containing protein [Gemmatimonadaceae bacterium]|nr:serine hydrolase domain-containing protein [Gemmatimonadaceae bacterium]